MMIDEAIKKLTARRDLTKEEAGAVMDEIMSGGAGEIRTAAYLTALAAKGETVDEIIGSASSMRERAERVPTDIPALEIVGTGGDGAGSFNISTSSAFVLAAAGVKVAKHGNRAATSKCGAADVLEALGADIGISAAASAAILERVGFCFLFAQKYHTAMKYVAPVRKALPIRTVFNIIGPLANPVHAKYQLMGVYNEQLVEPMARVLGGLGVKRGMVFFGTDGLDEISPSAETIACRFEGEKIEKITITPETYGVKRCNKSDLLGGTPEENARIMRAVLGGESGPKADAVALNAAFALAVYRDCDAKDAMKEVRVILRSGAALDKLNEYVAATRENR